MSERSQGLPRPKPGTRGVKTANMPAEKTCAWPLAPGPKGPKMNRTSGFHEVKVSAKQDMADDIYGNGPATIGQPLTDRAIMPMQGMLTPDRMNPEGMAAAGMMPAVPDTPKGLMNISPGLMPGMGPGQRIVPIGRRGRGRF